MTHHKLKQNGFALLMALIVVGVVISIGLVVLDLTLKQLRLSTTSKDSETAFHAANAVMECARFIRNNASTTFEGGSDIASVDCFGQTINVEPLEAVILGRAYKYDFKVTWGDNSDRCSEADILVINSDISASTTVSDIQDYIEGYPDTEKECAPGGRCTVIAARGYSRSCTNKTLPGTVEREVLLEL